jgi:hypothetical protein
MATQQTTMTKPLMRKAVAVWLIGNTTLTFNQIAQACDLHIFEVQAIADGDLALNLVGCDPRATGEINDEEIKICEKDKDRIVRVKPIFNLKQKKKRITKSTSYSNATKRRVKPDATIWLIQNYPELSDDQIVKLVKTTAKIVKSIRNKTYWNDENLKPRDPILFKLCSQEELEEVLLKVRISNQSEKRMQEAEESMMKNEE